jgi:hypothetical protein
VEARRALRVTKLGMALAEPLAGLGPGTLTASGPAGPTRPDAQSGVPGLGASGRLLERRRP